MKSVESYDMFIIIQDLQGAKECSVLWAQRERLSAFGHTFGVRVDGASPRRFLRFLSLTALRAEGCGIALSGDEYEVSVTDSPFCVIWHDRHSGD